MLRLAGWTAVTFFVLSMVTASAFGQATRTWVSGVGDDANPCSRTAPCKTFAGAISKTAAGGEINAIDPGGYGAVTITKSITIDGGSGYISGVLAAGTNGIVVSGLPANAVVILRNLDINGAGTGFNGIRYIAGAGKLHIENSTIYGFTQYGIDFEPTTSSTISIDKTLVRNNNGGGLYVKPGASAWASVNVTDSRFEHSGSAFGVLAGDRSELTIRGTSANGNYGNGFAAHSTINPAEINLDNCSSSNNGAGGVTANGMGATIRMASTMITNNTTGINPVNGGNVISFGNNRIAGNTTDGAPTGTLGQQ